MDIMNTMQSDSAEESKCKGFLFVEVARTGKVPPSRGLRTAMQKHVMRDIGRMRKGKSRPQKPPVEKEENLPAYIQAGIKRSSHRRHVDIVCKRNNRSVIPQSLTGSGRIDPFANYPIEMTQDSLFLIDHGSSLLYRYSSKT